MRSDFYYKKSPGRVVFYSLSILVALALAFFLGRYSNGSKDIAQVFNVFDGQVLNKQTSAQNVDFKMFWEVWDILKRDYVERDQLTDKKLFYGALSGLVSATDDPYSVFLNPEEAKAFEEDLSGTFEGIGAEIGFRNDMLTVIAPLEGMPAIKAGLQAGDKIYAIDGKTTIGLNVDEAVKKIRGPKGTKVTLTIIRAKDSKPLDITITRDTVVVKSVTTDYNQTNKIFTIKISSFNNDSEDLFNQAVQEVLLKKPKGLILDLRNNPGGYLETAVVIASEWIKEGLIVTEQFGDSKKIDHNSIGTGRLANIPTVVLVNQGSASASEIVAGALKDNGLATLIGEKTFGKGSVQVLRQLEDGSVIKVTTAKWLTPQGNNINEQGIEVDTKVEITAENQAENKDLQLDEAIKYLLK